LSAAINFVLVAAVVYFFVVLPYNKMRSKASAEPAVDKTNRLLTEIRDALGGQDTKPEFERGFDITQLRK
jgi:large conductance mechanosensitive channel